jgi:hypothetical protein
MHQEQWSLEHKLPKSWSRPDKTRVIELRNYDVATLNGKLISETQGQFLQRFSIA